MRTATPVATMLLAAVLASAVAWEGVNLWRQAPAITMPTMKTPTVMRDLPASGTPSSDRSSASEPRLASAPVETETSVVSRPATGTVVAPQGAVGDAALPNAATSPPVDETALRYFARQGDTRRLNAEIARLRSLYPDWTPPQDPLKAAPIVDPQLDRLWQLYAQGKFSAVREAVAARQSAEIGWTPPKDLVDRLALADMRERLVNASEAKQYGMVIQIAASEPSLRTCGDVDILWRVAEAFVRTDRQSRALDAYRYMLTTCTSEPERIATMQKAAALLSRQNLAPLFEFAHAGREADEFRLIREDLARQAISAGGTDAKSDASSEDVAVLEKLAETGTSSADPMLLGWYFLRRDDAAGAERWFRASYDRQNAAESAQGLALALVKLKRPAEAEAILARWRTASDDVAKAYLAAAANLLAQQPAPAIASDVLARIVESVAKQRDAAVAQELGWYSHAYNQDETALRWFVAALSWRPDDEPSAYGLAVVDFALNRRDALRALARAWQGKSPRIVALLDPAVARTLAAAPMITPGQGRTADAIVRQDGSTAPNNPSSPDATRPSTQGEDERPANRETAPASGQDASGGAGLERAWRLMKLDRPAEAAAAFRAKLATANSKERQEAAYGLSLANLRMGLTDEADVASRAAPQTSARVGEIRLAILTQRIRTAYGAGAYADALAGLDIRAGLANEQIDLMVLRGWSYYHLQRYEEAVRVFEAIAASGHDEALSALGIARSAAHRGGRG
jgi:cellulose synthase operon protein C